MKKFNNTMVIILDGWGHGSIPERSAIHQASTPFVDSLYEKYPNAELITHGTKVGLPEGQMGNSEVGHLNIGAGRIVFQELLRINNAIESGDFEKNHRLQEALEKAQNRDLHLIGLVSDGGVHSHLNHVAAICKAANLKGCKRIFVHASTDGRDTSPTGGLAFLTELEEQIEGTGARIASICGRYYSMDRDLRWERTKLAYDLFVKGEGENTNDFKASLARKYKEGITDEFIKPLVIPDPDGNIATIKDDDVVIMFNFRTDRCRQITKVLVEESQGDLAMHKLKLHCYTMTRYDEKFQVALPIYEKDNLVNTLGEIISNSGKSQLRIAETEKYPHVTFFFSGGREEPFEGENRCVVPSPKVATYDMQPEMSAGEITSQVINEIKSSKPNFICLNYANTDMVGHTGDFKAAMTAASFVDSCLEKVINASLSADYATLVIADHGNSDYMINNDGSPNTAHSTNPVPIFLICNNSDQFTLRSGILADVAPTILSLFGIQQPEEITGHSLI